MSRPAENRCLISLGYMAPRAYLYNPISKSWVADFEAVIVMLDTASYKNVIKKVLT